MCATRYLRLYRQYKRAKNTKSVLKLKMPKHEKCVKAIYDNYRGMNRIGYGQD